MTAEEKAKLFQLNQQKAAKSQEVAAMMVGTLTLGGSPTPNPLTAPLPTPVKEKKSAFKVGDTVQLKDYTIYGDYRNHEGQPATITNLVSSDNWQVVWSDGVASNVNVANLVLVEKKQVSLSSVVMSDEKRDEIQAAISQLHNTKLIFETWGFGSVFEKGTAVTLLFYGTPGTGKTLTAQAIADELGAELKVYGAGEIQSSEPGGAERAIKKIFTEAKDLLQKKKQRVILLDECDSLLYDRNKVGVILGAQINALLSEIEHHEGIVIFTTNRLGTLDPALERRITAKIEFEFPDKEARHAIWKRMIPVKAPLAKDVNLTALAEHALAGGNIKNVVLNAARTAAYQKAKAINMQHFTDAITKELHGLKAFTTQHKRYTLGRPVDYIQTDNHKLSVGQKMTNGEGVKRLADNL